MRTTLLLMALVIVAPCAAQTQTVGPGPYVPGQPISHQTCRVKGGECPASSIRPLPVGTPCVCHSAMDMLPGTIAN